mgnify:CR=1 FL=1
MAKLSKFDLELAEISSHFENIIDIITEIDCSNSDIEFLKLLLNKSLNIIPEADYGRIYVGEQGNGYFLKNIYKENRLFLDEFKEEKLYNKSTSDDIVFIKGNSHKKLIIELKINNNVIGAVILFTAKNSPIDFSCNSKRLASAIEKLASSYLSVSRYNKLQKNFTEEIIISLTNLLEIHDNYTKGHNQNVANISRKIAEEIGLNKNKIKKAYWTGILHDIGKTIIPAKILNKKGDLSTKEFEKIKKHPEWGYKTLKNSTELKEIAIYVLHHHERWDGSGYPSQLRGKEIPLISRIVTLADSWDAMSSNRSYRSALSREKAVEEIIKNSGKQFDPGLIDIFLDKIIKIN